MYTTQSRASMQINTSNQVNKKVGVSDLLGTDKATAFMVTLKYWKTREELVLYVVRYFLTAFFRVTPYGLSLFYFHRCCGTVQNGVSTVHSSKSINEYKVGRLYLELMQSKSLTPCQFLFSYIISVYTDVINIFFYRLSMGLKCCDLVLFTHFILKHILQLRDFDLSAVIVFLKFHKASDKVSHPEPLNKLNVYGIRHPYLAVTHFFK